MNSGNSSTTDPKATDGEIKNLIRFEIVCAFVIVIVFLYLIGGAPPFQLLAGDNLEGVKLLVVSALMFFSGALGGSLYNFRGLTKHLKNQDFKKRYITTYHIRPISAGICGILVFIFLLGGVMTLTLGTDTTNWSENSSILPFVAIAILAGFGSNEFLKKVKDIIATMFALSKEAIEEDLPDTDQPVDDN